MHASGGGAEIRLQSKRRIRKRIQTSNLEGSEKVQTSNPGIQFQPKGGSEQILMTCLRTETPSQYLLGNPIRSGEMRPLQIRICLNRTP